MKELKKYLKTINSLPSEDAAEKVIYIASNEYNTKWSSRKLRGFKEASPELYTLFKKRYGNRSVSEGE